MWHEARKQERRIRGMIVDYRRRAERRQDFYEKIQADPTQFIQVHGRRCKIHLDPAVAAAGDGAAIIVPWQGQQDNLIDRFDVRAHLDYIPPVLKTTEAELPEIPLEERQCNYERYRILAQNDFLNVPEERFLHQLYLEEQFGAKAQLEAERNTGKKKQQKSGATIGYSYDDGSSTIGPQPFSHLMHAPVQTPAQTEPKAEKDSESDSDSDMDVDVSIDITKLDTTQAHELNGCGRNYGMLSNDFYSYLTKDADEADALRIAREEEQEKILLSGRKSRRERRAQKERRIACRPFSPPSYAAKEEVGNKEKDEESESRSPSPSDANAGKITYITSFGGEDELQPHTKISINLAKGAQPPNEPAKGDTVATVTGKTTYAEKVKENLEQLKLINQSSKHKRSRHRSDSRSRSCSRNRGRDRCRHRHRSRSRSRSYDRRRRDRYSRSSSYEYSRRTRRHKRSRSHSRSTRQRHHRRSTSSSTASSRSSSSRSNESHHIRRKQNVFQHKNQSRQRSISVHKRSRSQSPAPAAPQIVKKPIAAEKLTEISAPPALISYPLPANVAGFVVAPVTVPVAAPPPSEPEPSADIASATVEEQTPEVVEPPPPPLKRYYGRKRGDDSSSNIESDSDGDNDTKTTKPQTGDGNESDDHLDVDTTSERSDPLLLSTTSGKQTGKYSTTQAKNPSFSIATETKVSKNHQSIYTASINWRQRNYENQNQQNHQNTYHTRRTGRRTDVEGSDSGTGSRVLNLRERLKRKMQNLLNKQYKADKRAEIEKSEREKQQQQEREDEMRELALKLRRRQRELRHRYGTPTSSKASESDGEASESAKAGKSRRSKSRSSGRSEASKHHKSSARSRDCEDNARPSQAHSRRSVSGGRRRTRSRSQSQHRSTQQRSYSRSRNRRSSSRKRRRSRQREHSHERTASRYGGERAGYDERYRRSRSRNERGREHRDRDRQREREHERERYSRGSDRYRREGEAGGSNKSGVANVPPADAASSSRNRIVISAPPKLKKLVDY